MHRKLLYKTLRQLGRWAYNFQVWWETKILHTIDHWTDHFEDHNQA